MQQRVARIGDTAAGTCFAHNSPRSWTGVFTVATGGFDVEGQQAVTIEDVNNTSCGHHFRVQYGSAVLTGNGKKIARMGDACIVLEGGNGVVTSGANYVTSE